MNSILLGGGKATGVLGLLVMAFAVVMRLSGRYVIGGFQTVTLLQAGLAIVIVGCFAMLWLLVDRAKN